MKRFLVASAAFLGLTGGAALAADMPVKAPVMQPPVAAPTWSGFYIGANAGVAWGRSNWNDPLFPTGNFDLNGGVIGGTAGYNWQMSSLVFGVEGDLDYANVDGSTARNCAPSRCETKVGNWLGTVRGRLGFTPMQNWLLYVTGGGAFADVKAVVQTVPGVALAGVSQTKSGWVIGGGVEWSMSQNWSAKAEYLNVDLSNLACTVAQCGGSITDQIRTRSLNIVRIGVNYRFGGGGPVVAAY